MPLSEYLSDDKTIHLVNIVSSQYENFTLDDTINILPKLILFVDKFQDLTGFEKREFVIEILKLIIDKTDLPGNDELIDPILKQFIPKFIDTLIEVDKRKINLRKRKTIWKKIKNKIILCLQSLRKN